MTAVTDSPVAGGAFADPCDARLALRAPGVLGVFNAAGVLNAADVHVALRLGRFGNEADDAVLLAAALAVRAPRLGHVHVDLAAVRHTTTVDVDVPVDLQALPWPEAGEWVAAVRRSPVVADGEGGPDDRPLRLVGSWLYLDRYWREERQVAADLAVRAEHGLGGVDVEALRRGLERLFPSAAGVPDQLFPVSGAAETDRQRLAAAVAVLRPLTVVAGGPGTGKTTTVARILALLDEQARASGSPFPLVALTAPTGKAAARLEEAVHQEAARLDVPEAQRGRLLGLQASTLHRLLGWQPGNRSRFRHHRGNRLPHDVIVVDETSMVSLSQMAKLVEAVRPDARLILVGDPQQLASVEAGAVLGDIVGPATDRLVMRPAAMAALEEAIGGPAADGTSEAPALGAPGARGTSEATAIGDGIVVLQQVHRFGGGIAAVADAVRRGDADAAIEALSEHDDVTWIPVDLSEAGGDALRRVRKAAVEAGAAIAAAARAGEARAALDALGGFRMLCAHRRGAYGVATWGAQVEAWLAAEVPGFAASGAWYVGRPLLVTENDYTLGLYNGDTGVVVAAGGERLAAVFERRGQILEFSPARLSAVETVHVMTVHKSQGSQFDTVAALLPDPDSPILTRELLYTAVTRARRRLILAGSEESLRAAVTRPVARSSGLRRWLWEGGSGPGR
ncbi:MAG TPA: exodeoxyribonuclease V subunit alpha [Acidimicrobiia bacterium]|nr:exodeoxyribonuclease V subunit alpha [Acidimicrobiia bacterium]